MKFADFGMCYAALYSGAQAYKYIPVTSAKEDLVIGNIYLTTGKRGPRFVDAGKAYDYTIADLQKLLTCMQLCANQASTKPPALSPVRWVYAKRQKRLK